MIALQLDEAGDTLSGTATTNDETVDIVDGATDGADLTWKISITKPVKMTLTFKVTQDGDHFAGTVKSGIFPAMKVDGTRG